MSTEEEIRALCLLVLQARCTDEFDEAIHSLRAALADHLLELENLAIHMLLNRPHQVSTTLVVKVDDKEEPKD